MKTAIFWGFCLGVGATVAFAISLNTFGARCERAYQADPLRQEQCIYDLRHDRRLP